jgi:hypothetical protein
VRPRAGDGSYNPQIRRLAANVLNKHLRTADKGCSSSLGVDRRGQQFMVKDQHVIKHKTGPRIWQVFVKMKMNHRVP